MLISRVGAQKNGQEGSLTPSSAIAEPQLVIYVSRSPRGLSVGVRLMFCKASIFALG